MSEWKPWHEPPYKLPDGNIADAIEHLVEQMPTVTGYCSACDEDTEIAVWDVPTENTRINICYHCLDAMNEGQR